MKKVLIKKLNLLLQEARREDAKALAYAKSLEEREVSSSFGMGVDDDGY